MQEAQELTKNRSKNMNLSFRYLTSLEIKSQFQNAEGRARSPQRAASKRTARRAIPTLNSAVLKLPLKTCLFLIFSCLIFSGELFAEDKVLPELYKPQPVKVLCWGWDSPDVKEFCESVRDMEETIPADGIIIRLNAKTMQDGKNLVLNDNAFLDPEQPVWKKEWLEPLVNELKSAKSEKFTDNFLVTGMHPAKVDWFDDEGWKQVCEKFARVAWVAKEGGCKGILFDTEAYGGRNLWNYNSSKSGHSFMETWDKARQRGQEFITAVCKEYPDIKIIVTFWLGCVLYKTENLQSANEGLIAAFANGVFDKVSPEAEIIDAFEAGYTLADPSDFSSARQRYDQGVILSLHPENVRKFKYQGSLAIPLYVDSYVNTTGRYAKQNPEGMTNVQFFKRNLSLAMKNSGTYVWLFGEQGKWWNKKYENYSVGAKGSLPNTFGKGRMWNEIMPGITDAVNSARRPLVHALQDLESGKFTKNLVENGSFENGFKGWSTAAQGIKRLDGQNKVNGDFSVMVCNSNKTELTQNIAVKAGNKYLVRGFWRTMQNSKASIIIKLTTQDNAIAKEVILVDHQNCSGFQETAEVLNIPENANTLSIILQQESDTAVYHDRCYFDNFGVYELSETLKLNSTDGVEKAKALLALREGHLGDNLLINGDFEKDEAVSGWTCSQSGDFINASEEVIDGNKSALLRYMKRGTLRQVVPVKPGDSLLLVLYCKTKGNVTPEAAVQWKDQNNKWLTQEVSVPFSEKLKNGWMRASKVIDVPSNAGYLGLHVIMISPEASVENMCYFDDIRLYNLNEKR